MTACECNWGQGCSDRVREVIRLFGMSSDYVDQTPGRSGITGMDHALRCAGQAAERGLHTDSAFIGLVHDLGRPLNDVHHGEVIAEIVKDRVSTVAYDVLRSHGEYQAAYVHDLAYPSMYNEAQRVAMQLVGFEVLSFSNDYAGPTMKVVDALRLLHEYLG